MNCSSFLSLHILIYYTVIMGGDNEQMNNLYLVMLLWLTQQNILVTCHDLEIRSKKNLIVEL